MKVVAWRSVRLTLASLLVIAVAVLCGAPRPQVARGALAVVAVPDVLSMKHDRTAVVPAPGVLGNDLNVLGGTTAIQRSLPSHGSVNLRADGGYTYVPNAGYVGTDVFRYQPSGPLSTTTTVTITITNAAPVSVADSYAAMAGVALHVASPGVLANDSDADGDALTATLVGGVGHGSLSLAAGGGFTYTANSGYSGVDTFTYRAADGISSSAITAVSLVVSAPTPSPTASPTPSPTPTPRPSPSATPTPPTPTPAPTSPLPSQPLPSQPLPSAPAPSVPIPSVPLPSPSISPSPGASLPLPSLPVPNPSGSPSPGGPQPSGSSGSGPSSSSGPLGGSASSSGSSGGTSDGSSGGSADGFGGGGDGGGGLPAPVVIGPNGLGVRTTAAGSERLSVGGLNLASLQFWLVPGAVIGGPGLLALVWLAIQVVAGMAWVPAARRVRGQEQDRRRRAARR